MIDEFSLLKCIGKGSFGEVFLTSKMGSNQFFATKKVSKQKADSPAIKKYFINELTILREISHKNIIRLEAIKLTIHNYYIITEYCNGGGLSDCLKKYISLYGSAFSEEIVQYLMRQIVEALKYLHGLRIIHRDIKLDNILVKFENEYDKNCLNMLKAQVKIIDFGFATHLGASNLRFSTLGSPINMDPILLKKLTAAHGTANLIGYDEKADIWSLGTVCYEMLIGQGVFNAETMTDLIRKVEFGNYHVPTSLSKEVVSFLNAMLQYSARNRLSAEQLSRHYFLTKNIKDFKQIDLTKVSHKVDYKGLNINIKRNQSIWAIFKEEDEKALIDIPGKYLVDNPIPEQDEYSQKTNIIKDENPFKKANTQPTITNNVVNNNNVINNNNQNIKQKDNGIDYNLLKQQQKIYYQINIQNNNNKRYANYIYNNQATVGTVNAYPNYKNYYVNGQAKYYNANLTGKKNITTNPQPVAPTQTIPTANIANNLIYQAPQTQTNQILIIPQYQNQTNNQVVLNTQYQQNQYTYTTQPQYTTINTTLTNIPIQNKQKAQIPVPAQKKVVNQVYQQPTSTPQISLKNYQNQNIKVQQPIIIPVSTNKYDTSSKNQIKKSKISAISSATTKTEIIPPGTKVPKYENYENFYKMIDLENYRQEIKYNDNKKIISKQGIQPQPTVQTKSQEPKSQTKQIEIKSPQSPTYIQQPQIYTEYPDYQQKTEKNEEKQNDKNEQTPTQYQTQPYSNREYNYYEQNKKYKDYNQYSTQTHLKKNTPKTIEQENKYQTKTYNTQNSPVEIIKYKEPKNNLKNYNENEYVYQNKKIKDLNANINEVKIVNINSNKYEDNYEQKNYENKKSNKVKIKKIDEPINNTKGNSGNIYYDNANINYEENNFIKINNPIVIDQTKLEQNDKDVFNYEEKNYNYIKKNNQIKKAQTKEEQNYIEQPNYEEINYRKIEIPKEIHHSKQEKIDNKDSNYEFNYYKKKEEEINTKKLQKKFTYDEKNYHTYRSNREGINESGNNYREYRPDTNYEDNNYRKRDEKIQKDREIKKCKNDYEKNNNPYSNREEIRQQKSNQRYRRNLTYEEMDYKKVNNQTEIKEPKSGNKYKQYNDETNYEDNYYKQNNTFEIEQSKSNKKNKQNIDNNIDEENNYNEPFPMPDNNHEYSPFEKGKKEENENDYNQCSQENQKSKKDGDSSDELDDLIDFKLGDELCPEPDNYSDENKKNEFKDNESDDNLDLPMKKIMEVTVERPTIGVPPPGTDLNDDFNYEGDDNNGVFQSNYRRGYDNDDYN